MNYIYPNFGVIDFLAIRIGGPGLGNILFTYADAFALSKQTGFKLIWPTWTSIKIGTIIRREKDKRFYHNLFKNNTDNIDKMQKVKLLLTLKRINAETYIKDKNKQSINNKIIEVKYPKIEFNNNLFKNIRKYRLEFKKDIEKNLTAKNKELIQNIDLSDGIIVHIRMQDFQEATIEELINGKDNVRIPVQWFKERIEEIRNIINRKIKVYVMSDGSDKDLEPILNLENTQRIDFKISIINILAMTQTNLIIASGSTFSLWSRFLGQMSSITFKNQYKEKVLENTKDNFEIDIIDKIDKKYHDKIRKILAK